MPGQSPTNSNSNSSSLSRRDALRLAAAGAASTYAVHVFASGPGAESAGTTNAGVAAAATKATPASASELRSHADAFLKSYTTRFQKLYYDAAQAAWAAATDVKEVNTKASIEAQQSFNQFVGNESDLRTIQLLRQNAWRLDPLINRQINAAFFRAAQSPGTLPELVAKRTEAEVNQSATQDGFIFKLAAPDGGERPITANDIDDVLTKSTNEPERLAAWEASKTIGAALRPGLLALRDLRNQCARALGFSSYFGLMVGEYGMTPAEMTSLGRTVMEQTRPLFEHLHCYAKHELASRYGLPVPRRMPAHWVPNRWAQSWPGLVAAADLDPLFKSRKPEWMIEQAERFYTSMGFPALPKSFYDKSDLYDLPAGSPRKKNTHASAWHLDLEYDVRSLMSVKPNYDWFSTTHHELGHIYYYLAYTGANVPLLLREGANRGFHEGIGELISLACAQRPYLAEIGVLDTAAARQADANADQWLLAQALDGSNLVFQPWAWGVMTGWEHDFYEKELPAEKLNERWWELASTLQGVEPPSPRQEPLCDAATKTHVNDDPAGYYDYAVSSLIVYQVHGYIAKNILKQDPRNCNYYGRKDVGEYLQAMLALGATRDWREVLRDFTGEDLSARAMLEYYEPLLPLLQKINKGRDVSFT